MIKISSNNQRDLNKMCEIHYTRLKKFLSDKLLLINNHSVAPGTDPLSKELTILNTRCSNSYNRLKQFSIFLYSNDCQELEKVVKCEPDQFTQVFKSLDTTYNLSHIQIIRKGSRSYQTKIMYPSLKLLFDYDGFSSGVSSTANVQYSAFDLVKGIGLQVCPYCNRQYITVVENNRMSKGKQKAIKKRPHLDHFYPRSKYPIFGISFYNLIPSCSFCNSSFKGSQDTTTEKHIHPYYESYGSGAKFRFKSTSNGLTTELNVIESNRPKRSRINKSSKLFEISEVYKSHNDTAQEIYDKSLKQSKYQAASIRKILSDIKSITKSEEEFYQFYFGNYHNEDDFEKRPLAKFTADLVDELQVMQLYNQK